MVLIFPRVPIVFTLSSFELRSDLAVCQSDNPFGLRTKSDQFFKSPIILYCFLYTCLCMTFLATVRVYATFVAAIKGKL